MGEAVRSTIGLRDASGVVRHGAEWLALWADPVRPSSAPNREWGGSAIAATLRAIAGGPAPGETVVLPPDATSDQRAAARGRADEAGLRLRHHDPALHASLAPREARARKLFDVLEAARWQALGVATMPGCLPNFAAAMDHRLDKLGLLDSHLAAQVPLAEALPMLALDALLGREAPLLEGGAMATWHGFARRRFGQALDALRPRVADQVEYAAAARVAVAAMFDAMQWDQHAEPSPTSESARLPMPDGRAPTEAAGPDEAGQEEAGRGARAATRPAGGAPAPYHAFTTSFDRVADAGELVSDARQAELRDTLDRSLADLRAGLARMANRLQRRLQATRLSSWDFDLEEGLLDAARLARVIAEPSHPLSFKQERLAAARDTVVSLLIDNSGSMRGRPIALAAIAADIAARALERCGIACEVLGFTTVGWRGGRSFRAWATAGRPGAPGRVCDLLHVIYKSAGEPYGRARRKLAVMMDDALLRENVDGEALLWAAGRLRQRPERRKLLLVISDGAPNDRATLDANRDPRLLQRHLAEVVRGIETRGLIELSALGIGHAVGEVYRHAETVADAQALGPALLSQLGQTLTGATLPSVTRRRAGGSGRD